jgi:hypothetical protein
MTLQLFIQVGIVRRDIKKTNFGLKGLTDEKQLSRFIRRAGHILLSVTHRV